MVVTGVFLHNSPFVLEGRKTRWEFRNVMFGTTGGIYRDVEWPNPKKSHRKLTVNVVVGFDQLDPQKRFEVRNWNGLLHYVGRVSSHNLQMNIWNLVGSCVSVEWKNTSPKNSPHNFQGTKWNLDFVSWILVHWKSQGTNIFYPWKRKLINSNMSQGVVWGYGRPEFFPS